MPLRTRLTFRNPDLSSDINYRLRDLIGKGVFYNAKQVLPVAGVLEVSVLQFAAMGADGMVTTLEGTPETLTVQAGLTQWVLLHAEYVANNVAIAELEVLTEAEYGALSSAEQEARVKLAKVTLGPAATEVTNDDISFVDADFVDPVGRSSFRGVVGEATDLPDYTDPPTGITNENRPADIYYVQGERLFYSWNVAGTPQWSPIISAAEEVALANHKDNQDDGTVPPDFFNAQHVLVKHRESLDAGTASSVNYGSEGTDFGSTNPLVDGAYPVAAVRRVDVTGLTGATSVQLTGWYYVGKGGIGTAQNFFRLATYQTENQLIASNRAPITVLSVFRSDGSFQLDPGADADPLGYYEDPIVKFDFTGTGTVDFTGNLSIYCSAKRTYGSLEANDFSIGHQGLGFVRPAQDIPVIGQNFDAITTATNDIQEALENLDTLFASLGGVGASIPDPGYSAVSRTMKGLQLAAVEMDTTDQYTSAVKFMSTDSAFTTENPKLLAAIVGRATEGYGTDTDGGMAIDFFTTPNDPGATTVPSRDMSLWDGKLYLDDVALTGLYSSAKLDVHYQGDMAGDLSPASIRHTIASVSSSDDAYGLIVTNYFNAASGTLGWQGGIWVESSLIGTGGTSPTAEAISGKVTNVGVGTGAITKGYVFRAYDGSVGSGFGTHYGFYCNNLSAVTNSYGFYALGANTAAFFAASGKSYFIDATTPAGSDMTYPSDKFDVELDVSSTPDHCVTGSFALSINGITAAKYHDALVGHVGIDAPSGTVDGAEGVWGGVTVRTGGADVTWATGIAGFVKSDGSGTMTEAAALSAYDGAGTGTIGAYYGVWVDSITKGTNGYGIYVEGATTQSIHVESGDTWLGGSGKVMLKDQSSLRSGWPTTIDRLEIQSDSGATGDYQPHVVETAVVSRTGGGDIASIVNMMYLDAATGTYPWTPVYFGNLSTNASTSTATITNAEIFGGQFNMFGAEDITNAAIFRAYGGPAPSGSGVITNYYGLYVDVLTRATNNYAVFVAGTTTDYGLYITGAAVDSIHVADGRVALLGTDNIQSTVGSWSYRGLGVYYEETNQTGNFHAHNLLSEVSGNTGGPFNHGSVDISAWVSGSASASLLYGAYSEASSNSSGTVASAMAYSAGCGFWNQVGAIGTITKAVAYKAMDGWLYNGSIGSYYGIEIDSITAGTTNNYGIYVGGASGGSTNNYALYVAANQSYFGDDVGIGVAPGRRLHVSGTAPVVGRFDSNTTGAGVSFKDATTTADNAVTVRAEGDDLVFHAGATRRMHIESDGKVGIGPSFSTPLTTLHLYESDTGGSPAAGTVLVVERNDDAFISIMSANTDGKYGALVFADSGSTQVGRLRYHHYDNSMELWTAAVQRIHITNTGYVGIGNSFQAPDSLVHIYDGASGLASPVTNTLLTLENDDDAYLSILTTTSDSAGIYCGHSSAGDVGGIIYDHSNDRWDLIVEQIRRAYLTSNGLVVQPGTATGITPTGELCIDDSTAPSLGFLGFTGGSIFFKATQHSTTGTMASITGYGNAALQVWQISHAVWDLSAGLQTVMQVVGYDPSYTCPSYGWIGVNSIQARSLTLAHAATQNCTLVDASNSGTVSTAAGWIEVNIGGATRWIQTYSTGPA